MARRRKGLPVHGWLILDKPEGMTSSQAVGKLRYLFNAQKAGHAGTLDPLATGILPIGFGEATKTMPYVVDGTKAYRFTIRFGAETDTEDAEGAITARSDARPDRAAIEAALPRFTGEIEQVPPRYSALKVDGERAYDLAREGSDFELAARTVTIDSLDLVDMPDSDHAVIETQCGKGTYIRSLARDLARNLGARGHVSALRRTRVGPFTESAAISLEKLEELGHSAAGRDALLGQLKPLETALDDIPALAISGDDAARLRRGQPVLIRGRDAPIIEGPAYATSRGRLVAVGEVDRGEMRPTRVFNIPG
ncbi:tRNA pseudouridine synthase B [Methyloligella halotolerans]|uniref:tRNA pseudouridine synthase B n=1 Tax=Methyloligella halotolerans TaxID=1177755 RepID=A0A1E2RW95_9HYPH|nr:tRNA pseudouridine(55) synthase TruB [Methyloligella halotolerans]ODA66358.1 tRNA pseudouridine synthase B [Methyloligella halotolerans]